MKTALRYHIVTKYQQQEYYVIVVQSGRCLFVCLFVCDYALVSKKTEISAATNRSGMRVVFDIIASKM